MVCHILRKALGDAKPADAAEINAYCRRASHDLVLRHLKQLYGDLNGNTFKQDLPPRNELYPAPPRDQIHSGQQYEAPPRDPMHSNRQDEAPSRGQIHSNQQDKPSRRSSLLSDPPPLDYASRSTRSNGYIRRWRQESENCRSQQSNTPVVNVARLLSLDDNRLDTLQERRERARSYVLEKVEKKNLGSRTTKSLPALSTGAQPNITLQKLEKISTSKLPSVKCSSGQLRNQQAGPSRPKNAPKTPNRNSMSTSIHTEGSHSEFYQDLGSLNSMIIVQIEFCWSLLSKRLSTDHETTILNSLKRLSDLLRRKSPEELEEIGVWKLEKLYGRSTQLCDRIRKRKNLEGIQKLCEEVNPIVEGWIENLVTTPNLSDISDFSEGVAGLQARRVDITARQFGKRRKRDVENSLKVVLQASGAGNEIPPKVIYLGEKTFP